MSICLVTYDFHFDHLFQDVDQATGEDLNPVVNRMLVGGEVKDTKARNPDR